MCKKKQNETTVVFQPLIFENTPRTKLFWGQRSLDIPLENPPTKLSQLSSCKVDDGIAEVMPRLARSKFPFRPEGRTNCEETVTPPPKWMYFLSDNSVKTRFFFWGGETWIEEYEISYQYDIDIVKEKLQRLHALFWLWHPWSLPNCDWPNSGCKIAKKIRTLAKQSASEQCLMIRCEVFHHLEMFVWQFRLWPNSLRYM